MMFTTSTLKSASALASFCRFPCRRSLVALVCGGFALGMAAGADAAGIVTTQLNGNVLTLTGDGRGNRVELKYANSALIVSVANYDDGTRFQGKTTFPNFSGDVIVNLGGGNDRFHAFDGNIALNNLTVDMGEGESEQLYLKNLSVSSTLAMTSRGTYISRSVAPGLGSDILIEQVKIGSNLRINTGAGTDAITIFPLDASPPRIAGNVSIDTRDGDDFVGIGINGSGRPIISAQLGGTLTIRTGLGNDKVDLWLKASAIDVQLGEGDDELTGFNSGSRGGTVRLDGGAGSDGFRNGGGNSSLFTQGLVSFERRY